MTRTHPWRAAALAVFLALRAGAAQSLPGDHVIVPGERIGAAELEPADQGALARALGEPDGSEQRGGHAFYLYAMADGELTVDFDLDRDAPFEISTSSPVFRTRDGVGVGSSEAAIRAALGPPLCESGDTPQGEIMVYDSIWFRAMRGTVIRVSVRKHLSPADFRNGEFHC